MNRKIVRLGQSTLVVSLPLSWVRKRDLKPGESVNVEESVGKLIISGKGAIEPVRGVLDVHEAGPLSRRLLAAMYKIGYDLVEVKFRDRAEMKDVEAAVDLEAVSYEIVSMDKTGCTIRSISELTGTEFDSLLGRTVFLLQTMSKDLTDAVRENDQARITGVKQLEKTNNKFTHLCRRALNKSGYEKPEKTALMYTIVEQLENIADRYKFLCIDLERNPAQPLMKETLQFFTLVDASVSDFCQLFMSYDMEKAKGFAASRKQIVEKGISIFEKGAKPKDAIAVHHLLDIIDMIFDVLGPVFALNMDIRTSAEVQHP